jgi:cytokinesis protein
MSSRTSGSSNPAVAPSAAASLHIEMKWQMVESDARARWEAAKDVRRKEEEVLRSGKKRTTVVVKNSPEWFLKKMLDGNLTKEHLGSLQVSLRSFPVE